MLFITLIRPGLDCICAAHQLPWSVRRWQLQQHLTEPATLWVAGIDELDKRKGLARRLHWQPLTRKDALLWHHAQKFT